jgi:hypothetical protein
MPVPLSALLELARCALDRHASFSRRGSLTTEAHAAARQLQLQLQQQTRARAASEASGSYGSGSRGDGSRGDGSRHGAAAGDLSSSSAGASPEASFGDWPVAGPAGAAAAAAAPSTDPWSVLVHVVATAVAVSLQGDETLRAHPTALALASGKTLPPRAPAHAPQTHQQLLALLRSVTAHGVSPAAAASIAAAAAALLNPRLARRPYGPRKKGLRYGTSLKLGSSFLHVVAAVSRLHYVTSKDMQQLY